MAWPAARICQISKQLVLQALLEKRSACGSGVMVLLVCPTFGCWLPRAHMFAHQRDLDLQATCRALYGRHESRLSRRACHLCLNPHRSLFLSIRSQRGMEDSVLSCVAFANPLGSLSMSKGCGEVLRSPEPRMSVAVTGHGPERVISSRSTARTGDSHQDACQRGSDVAERWISFARAAGTEKQDPRERLCKVRRCTAKQKICGERAGCC